MVIDPNNSSTYLSGGWVYNGSTYVMVVSRSTDAGVTWGRDTLTTTYSSCYAIAVDPSSKSNTIYAGGEAGIYKSTNAGVSWTMSSTGLSGTVKDIVVNPRNANVVYAGTSSGVYKSTNAGGNWSLTGLTGVNDIVLAPGGLDTLYAGTATGVSQSVNGGSTWTAMNTGLADTYVNALGINPGQKYLFAGTRSRGMYYWNLTVVAEEVPSAEARSRFLVRPNPTSGATQFEFLMPASGPVNITVYDAQGRVVTNLIDHQPVDAGHHCVNWNCCDENGSRVPAGVYFVKLRTAANEDMRKLLVVR